MCVFNSYLVAASHVIVHLPVLHPPRLLGCQVVGQSYTHHQYLPIEMHFPILMLDALVYLVHGGVHLDFVVAFLFMVIAQELFTPLRV